MPINRRQLLSAALAGAVVAPFYKVSLRPTVISRKEISTLLFDAFPVFDPRPVFALAERLFPGSGASFSETLRSRQFEYCWLRTLSGSYLDFWEITRDALYFAAAAHHLDLTEEKRDTLMSAYLQLQPWPDVLPSLKTLKDRGFKLAFLTNWTPQMIEQNVQAAGLHTFFDHLISTDSARTYKPSTRAYQMGLDVFKSSRKEEFLFVAHAGWDAAGAKQFGYPTFWVNRQGVPAEQLGAPPDAIGTNLSAIVDYLR